MKRRSFIQKACPLLVASQLVLLTNCSKNDMEPSKPTPVTTEEEKEFKRVAGLINNDGYFSENKLIYIDLANKNYANLSKLLNFSNIIDLGILLIRTDENTIKAFDNCCPHQGVKGSWTFENNRFKCLNHNNTFNITETNVVSCNSGSFSGGLLRYPTKIVNNLLKITT
jgi:nitrite reductase/ring-hydroxylating ferredoxin subunit